MKFVRNYEQQDGGDHMYVITGSTGNIGNVIAKELLKRNKPLRAIARHASKLKELEKLGAEILVGNLEDASFLEQAFHEASGVFTMNPPNAAAEDYRKDQRKVASAMTTAVRNSKVSHVVNLSSIGGELDSGTGPIAGLHEQEEMLNEIATANVLHLRPSYFMENFLFTIPLIKNMGVSGSSIRPDLSFPMIATIDIGRYAAMRLDALDFDGKSVQYLLGPRDLTWPEATKILGNSIGKPDLAYVHFPYNDELEAMVQAGLTRNVAELYREMSRALNEGLIPAPPRDQENTTPTTMEEFARNIFALAYSAS
jgi:uncharacterized protein YbjT (DUF2867 family)